MRLITVPILILTILSSMSCGDKKMDNDKLLIEVSSQSIVVPGTQLDCNGNEVDPYRIPFQKTTLSWGDKGRDLTILFIKIELREENVSGGSFSAIFSDDDLDNVFEYSNGSSSVIVRNGLIPGPTGTEPVVVTNRGTCRVSFGGMNIADPKKNFTASATITIQGIATGNGNVKDIEKGEEIPVRATTKTRVVFNLN